MAGVYYLAARLGLTLAFEQANISPVWPPTGIAIAALLFFGLRAWSGVFVGAFLANYFTNIPLLVSAGIATGNTLEAVTAAFLIARYAESYPFKRIVHVLLFVVTLVLTTMISASVGVVSLCLADIVEPASFMLLWTTWWLGDLTGGLVFVPLLITWVRKLKLDWSFWRIVELIVISALSISLSFVVFSDWLFSVGSSYSLAFLPLPLLVWASLRFKQHGGSLLVCMLSVIAILGTIGGHGPFLADTANESLLLLQSFIGVMALTMLALVASNDERLVANKRFKVVTGDLENRVQRRTNELEKVNKSLHREIDRGNHYTEAMSALLAATENSEGDQFYLRCVKDLARIYGANYAFIGLLEGDQSVKTVAVWKDGGYGENFSYRLEGTPCNDVLDLKKELIPRGASTIYSSDEMLVDMGIESYFGSPLISPSRSIVGLVVVMDEKPIFLEDWNKSILGLYSNRIALELEHKKANDELLLAASVFKETVEAVVICDANNCILRVNPAFTRITGYSAEEAHGKEPSILKSGHQSDEFYQSLW